jgi:hypothetical protein
MNQTLLQGRLEAGCSESVDPPSLVPGWGGLNAHTLHQKSASDEASNNGRNSINRWCRNANHPGLTSQDAATRLHGHRRANRDPTRSNTASNHLLI